MLIDLFNIDGLSDFLSGWLCPRSLVYLAMSREERLQGLEARMEWVLSAPMDVLPMVCKCGEKAMFGIEDVNEPFIKSGRCVKHKLKTDLAIIHDSDLSFRRFRTGYFRDRRVMRWMDASAIARVDSRVFERMRRVVAMFAMYC